MSIQTKSFSISKYEFKTIYKLNYYRNTKLLFFLFVFLACILFTLSINYRTIPWAISCIIISVIIVCLPYVIDVDAIVDRLFWQTTYYKFDDNFIETFYADESYTRIKIDNYIKAVKRDNYFFVYMNDGKFICVPIYAFSSELEITEFETLLKHKKLL